uniref:Uncharacterized protein n=1 Tax=uncultured marine group II/III euryarchaeote KM3_195_B08 TaxID=1457970 RepID=A0A075GY97_9EURY|nr:hypothetical protein [uncultured marine group II/III euryarchaeote KM3_195_B08]
MASATVNKNTKRVVQGVLDGRVTKGDLKRAVKSKGKLMVEELNSANQVKREDKVLVPLRKEDAEREEEVVSRGNGWLCPGFHPTAVEWYLEVDGDSLLNELALQRGLDGLNLLGAVFNERVVHDPFEKLAFHPVVPESRQQLYNSTKFGV